MKLSLVLSFLLFGIAVSALAQGELVVVDPSVNPGLVLEEFGSKAESTAEKVYYHTDTWLLSEIKLKSGVILRGFPTKYDLFNNRIELKVDDVVKICPSYIVDHFKLYNPIEGDSTLFVDAKKYKFYDGAPVTGFLEVVRTGDDYSLAMQNSVEVQQSSYVEALDMGRKDEKLVKNEKFFIVKDDKVLCELKNNTKNLECPEIEQKLSSNTKMKTRSLSDKVEFIDYLNRL